MTSDLLQHESVPHFDVFLSYNSDDCEAVELIAKQLTNDGLNVWFDRWRLVPGESHIATIQQVLPNCKSVAVFVSDVGVGPWHELEIHAAICRRVGARDKCPLIPVLLPGASEPTPDKLP